MFKLIKRVWGSETGGMTAAAFIVGAASLASRLIGVIRDRMLAGTFGAGDQLDAYYAAFRLPDFLYTLIIFGALTAGFIPVFAEYLERRGKAEAMQLAEQVLAAVGIVMAVSCTALVFAAPIFVPFITPGFHGEKLRLTIEITRIMALSPVLLGLSAVMGGILQAMRRFVAFSLAPVFYNIGIIFGIMVLAPKFGIIGVAWGVVIGAALHFLAQASVAMRLGCCKIRLPSFRSEGVRRILGLMAPRAAGLAVSQVNLVVLLSLASTLEAGSVSVFNLANNLQSFPLGLFGISFAIAAFPELSRAAGAGKKEDFSRSFASAARKIAFLIIPTTVLFLLLRAQIVRLILGMGNFDWNDTIRTADVLALMAFSLPMQALIPLFTRAFYAMQNTWTPVKATFVAEAANIALALLLRERYGIAGLAIAFSAAALLQVALLSWALHRSQGSMEQRSFWISLGKTFLATLALLAAAYPLRQWIGTIYPLRTFFQVALQLGLATGGGLLAFFLASHWLRSSELEEFVGVIARRLWRRKTIAEGADEAAGM